MSFDPAKVADIAQKLAAAEITLAAAKAEMDRAMGKKVSAEATLHGLREELTKAVAGQLTLHTSPQVVIVGDGSDPPITSIGEDDAPKPHVLKQAAGIRRLNTDGSTEVIRDTDDRRPKRIGAH